MTVKPYVRLDLVFERHSFVCPTVIAIEVDLSMFFVLSPVERSILMPRLHSSDECFPKLADEGAWGWQNAS
ncbi:hypothetical protein IQ235_05055 [Oscillatoriales cyanobacterium LEGE 11467]|uniref:Uncharacterized protein n=1 Tax=Zarconia navalis LEGE 11467 TaxID=1828826 RepID=A0A928VTP0_9CYAN|nr:hypothetical protein [Zarconia navalis]MBE9040159.1 hypothetical protein [Zarconia navalis LEGE 11467]